MPSARSPATSAEMRSVSLTRSSPAPRTLTSAPWPASAAIAGSSSISPGTSSGVMSTRPMRSPSTMIVPRGSPAAPGSVWTSTRAPNRWSTPISAVRLGLRPTSSISTRDPGRAAAATIQKAADEKSPGTTSSWPASCCGPSTDTRLPSSSTRTEPPNAASACSVWSRVWAGSTTVVVPLVWSPASRTALFTCALGTGEWYVVAWSVVP